MPTMNFGRVGAALELLKEHTELTMPELAELMGISHSLASTILRRMTTDVDSAGKPRPKRAHVARWVIEQDRVQRVARAVFAPGDGPDAKKPRLGKRQCERDYYHRRKARAMRAAPSIFALGDQVAAHVAENQAKWQKKMENKRAKAMQAQNLEAA